MAWLSLLITLSALPFTFVIWTLVCLFRNYMIARSTGIPFTIRYITTHGPLWLLFSRPIIRILSHLPFTTSFINIYRRGWEGRSRYRNHMNFGDLFIIVTPTNNWLKVCNAALSNDILKRRDEFGRDLEAFEVLNVYGKNLATTDGADWNRHRKVAAVTFTEKNNELVWRESLKEGSQMLEYWLHRSAKPIKTLAQDSRIFTLNVLAAALFDKSYPFESAAESKLREKNGKKDIASEYRDSLSTILKMIIPILIFGEKKLREAWWLPETFHKAGHAVKDFRTYVTDLINEERVLIAEGKQNSPNLVTNLVRACEEEGDETIKTAGSKPSRTILTKDEIISDLFVFAFAGNDTTAITLTFLLAAMAANPKIQDWVSEEIKYYLKGSDVSEWNYAQCVKLKRCWAVIYETLRLCHPLSQIVKTTGNQARSISLDGKSYLIPAHTSIEINLPALQTHPRYWGSDSLTWNPKRFISGSSMETEVLPPDTTDVFFPWAFGKNVCPGKRFSQVELVAVMVVLFRDHGVEPVPENGETVDQARMKTGVIAQDIEQRLLHEMRQPERVAVRWFERRSVA
ncbi:cytochrome P450 monooxygenase-like protein [Melanomma pulvis-pyrius CBS 109.77]|uniref:Cytochrome P450 monooxygenase-like protein n=1 Tax=Melanomma pulvis-pyrius CBS 109.77 TaxID=1314802 RepID=A0A6A6X7A9_9PLEO|nr:cytochrome P450 monooxygenase-like protein [Melanomma pulvis-pyrius CBS 109.77]